MDRKRYDPVAVEKKWQSYWQKHQIFKAHLDPAKPKYYVLDMFPYPSGAGLHVGHVVGYTATDIIARYKRQKGFAVLHPMGWDSFGLPAEQYAIRTGTHPAETTAKNIATYKRQLTALGFSYDWDREVATSDPKYYKWTQWIFTLLYNQGLAYEAEMLVNYCPALGTVLSNEEVENGKARDGGHLVVRKSLRQWVLKITAYAERLLNDLDLLDWPEGLKKLQVNWIGRSEGALIHFPLDERSGTIEVFTTRPDTIFGVTYLVLAPEHPLVDTLAKNVDSVNAYRTEIASKSDLERTELSKEKTGVWTGSYAAHPITGEKLQIWIADYVLAQYGTGAVMAVPSHDERDAAFAKTYSLPFKKVIEGEGECFTGSGRCINSQADKLSLDGLESDVAKARVCHFLEENNVGTGKVSYKLRDWLFSRQRYWGEPFPILHFADGTKRALAIDELPLCPPQVENYKPTEEGLSPLSKVTSWVELVDEKTGKPCYRETNTMPQWAGSCWYYLRFVDPHNEDSAWSQEAENYWMPVDLYIGGAEHAVLHLLYARFWHKVLFDLKLVSTPEPFQALRNQGMIVAESYKKPGGIYVAPSDVEKREGRYVEAKTGDELVVQTEKMSKSKLNGVTPDEMIAAFGADSLRVYEMFMGPLEKEKIWNTEAVQGSWRFINRFWELCTHEKITDDPSEEGIRLAHKLLFAVSNGIETLQFNTAISKMMEFVNSFSKLEVYNKEALLIAIQCLAPFAPHIAEELWESLGQEPSVSLAPLPEVNPEYLQEAMATYVIQVNGKLRGRFDLPKGKNEEEILALAKENPHIAKYLENGLKKAIFVPDKLLNLVI